MADILEDNVAAFAADPDLAAQSNGAVIGIGPTNEIGSNLKLLNEFLRGDKRSKGPSTAGLWIKQTRAQMTGLGTSDGAVVGDVCFLLDEAKLCRCVVANANDSEWEFRWRDSYVLGGNDAVTTADRIFMDWQGETESTNVTGARVGLEMPHAGRLLSVSLLVSAGTGDTDIELHKNNTESIVVTQTLSAVAANVPQTAVMSSTYSDEHWAADEEIHICAVPTNVGSAWQLNAHVELKERIT